MRHQSHKSPSSRHPALFQLDAVLPLELRSPDTIRVCDALVKAFAVDDPDPRPWKPTRILFVPVQTGPGAIVAVRAAAIHMFKKDSWASAADIAGVIGRPFFTNDTRAIPFWRLKMFLSGDLDCDAAASCGDLLGGAIATHRRAIVNAVRQHRPVSAAAVIAYEIALPPGYVVAGAQVVFALQAAS